jgi:hypothetical protein
MGTRRWIFFCGLLSCAWLVLQIASPLRGQQKSDPAKSAAPATETEERELQVRYEQANLKLMEARLVELEATNRRNPNTIRPAAINLVREYVGKARERLKAAESGEHTYSRVYVPAAEAEVRLAEDKLKRAEAVNKSLPRNVSAEEIARFNAELEMAKIKLEKAHHMQQESPLSNLRFEIDGLRSDVQELRLIEAMRRIGS